MARDAYRKIGYMAPIDAARVKKLRGSKAELAKFLDNPPHEVGLHYYWHAIHYLLTGESEGGPEPLCYLLEGGEVIGANDGSPVRFLPAKLAAEFSDALADLLPDEFGEDTFDLETLEDADIYPGRWIKEGEDNDVLGTLRENYSYLQDTLAAAKREGKGVLIYFKEELIYADDDVAEDDDDDFEDDELEDRYEGGEDDDYRHREDDDH